MRRGEILALLGENGAGKTTLMNILFGHYQADEGDILIDGTPLKQGSTMAAIEAGVGMVHQHFTLADNLSVLENIMLGTESLWSFKSDQPTARDRIRKMSEDYGLKVDPDAIVADLSVGERQRVEILKALYRDAKILILDEPTAVLTPQESEQLFKTLRWMTNEGLTIIFISHKLHEILAISDRVAVLRRGALIATVETSQTDAAQLAERMIGKSVTRPQLTPIEPGPAVLEISAISTSGVGSAALQDLSLTIHAHEIVGIAGVAGNGQSTLADILNGLEPVSAGAIRLNGKPYHIGSPRQIVASGVGRIPEDRHSTGVVGAMALWENLISEDTHSPEISTAGWLINKSRALDHAQQQIETFDVRCEGPEAETKLLSGGNMQKLILARALSGEPSFILANQPVRGLDEGAISYVQGCLLEARARGAAILLISEDLDELLSLSDRIAVMHDGHLVDAGPTRDQDVTRIGLMMAGNFDQRAA